MRNIRRILGKLRYLRKNKEIKARNVRIKQPMARRTTASTRASISKERAEPSLGKTSKRNTSSNQRTKPKYLIYHKKSDDVSELL